MHYHPTLDELQQLQATVADTQNGHKTGKRPLAALCCDLLADMETPVSAYCKTARGPYSFLLESVEGGERIARYSFIGIDPYLVLTHHGESATLRSMSPGTSETQRLEEVPCHDRLQLIQAELGQYHLVAPPRGSQDALPLFHGGAVGYLAYEAVARFERLPVPEKDSLGLPLAIFCFTETVLAFDHLKHRVRIVTHLHLDAPDLEAEYRRGIAIIDDVQLRLRQPMLLAEEPVPIDDPHAPHIISNRTRAEFEGLVRRAIEYIRAGDI